MEVSRARTDWQFTPTVKLKWQDQAHIVHAEMESERLRQCRIGLASNNTDCLSCIRGTDMRSGTELYNTEYGRAGWSQIGGKIGKIQR